MREAHKTSTQGSNRWREKLRIFARVETLRVQLPRVCLNVAPCTGMFAGRCRGKLVSGLSRLLTNNCIRQHAAQRTSLSTSTCLRQSTPPDSESAAVPHQYESHCYYYYHYHYHQHHHHHHKAEVTSVTRLRQEEHMSLRN